MTDWEARLLPQHTWSRLISPTLRVLIFVFLLTGSSQIGFSQSKNERSLESTIPKDVPIKVNIKKEKAEAFSDSSNENWLSEFELEIVNTGDQPIYYFYLHLITDASVNGTPVIFKLEFGRSKLGYFSQLPTETDPSINPGETQVFKVPGEQIAALREQSSPGALPKISKVSVVLQKLAFGDGTGFVGHVRYRPGS